MSDWKRNEKTTTVVQYIVPADDKWGACWNEMQQALTKATDDWQEYYNGDMPSDDSIRVFPRDDAIVIEFDKPADPYPMTPLKRPITDIEIDERAHAYAREAAPRAMVVPDEPSVLTKGGVAALIRDAYRSGAISTAVIFGPRGASRYDNSGTDRRTYEKPCCGNTRPHDAHMHTPIGNMTVNCCGVS